MTEKTLRAVWGSPDRPLKIVGLEIPCYVLEDGTRVLSGRGMQEALELGQGHGALLKRFLGSNNLKPYINNELAMALSNPIRFIRPGRGGKLATGYEATILADICNAILEARDNGLLSKTQELVARQCEILTRAFAKVGIIALVDEATGYQEIRDREALQKILDKYLLKEFAAWAKRFPDEFYMLIFKLKGWEWKGMKVNRPSVVGTYTNDLVYERLAPGLLKELKRLNPKDDKGNRPTKHQQWLTEDIGHPALAQHLHAVMGFMRAAATWDQFYRMIQRAFPKKEETLPLLLED
ncbi:MAG TPA: P63C domain-containing protein [Nitrospirota bacterium]|nr:P63C domain-containing protein [Nitrospirota bacterium]